MKSLGKNTKNYFLEWLVKTDPTFSKLYDLANQKSVSYSNFQNRWEKDKEYSDGWVQHNPKCLYFI